MEMHSEVCAEYVSASRQDPNGVFLAQAPVFFGVFIFPIPKYVSVSRQD